MEVGMTQQPRSRIGVTCSVTAAGLITVAVIASPLHSESFILLLPAFFVGMVGVAVTAIELLAGYRGRPQKVSLVLGGVSCLLPLLYFALVLGSGN